MINSLDIQNFQSHKKSRLEFHSGVNVIIGPSDSGKTAVLRALRWVNYNEPSGDSFRSNWGGETVVSEDFENSDKVTRFRSNVENEYLLNDTVFTAFGREVPREIAKVINMNEVNLQSQFDSPFLLTSTPGEAAAHFNRIAHIDKIDIALKTVDSWIRKINQDIQSDERNLVLTQEKLNTFPDLEKMEIDIEIVEQLTSDRTIKIQQRSKIQSILTSITKVQKDIEGFSKVLALSALVENLLGIMQEKEEAGKNLRRLVYITDQIAAIKNKQARYQKLIELEVSANQMIALTEKAKSLISEKTGIENLLSKIRLTNIRIESLVNTLKEKELKFKREMPETCPLCGK